MNLRNTHKQNKKSAFGLNFSTALFSLVFFAFLLSSSSPVFAQHDATVTISPNITNCDALGNTFTVNVGNDLVSNDSILQVEIYKALAGLSNFTCGSAPSGWDLFSFTDRCIYVTELASDDKIAPSEDLDFTFNATMNLTACASNFVVVTIDDAYPSGDRDTTELDVKIDCTAPAVWKVVDDPKIPLEGYGEGENYWITQSTLLTAYGADNLDSKKCDLGLDYCTITYTVDGGDEIIEVNQSFESNTFSWDYGWYFDEDSEHFISITCYDVAGNSNTSTETDKVDDTPPNTTKLISEPKKVVVDGGKYGDIEWIDSVTEITLSAVDPEHPDTPEGYDCSIGVNETRYRITQVDDDYCWRNVTCEPLDSDAPFEVYTIGAAISNISESCHIMEYYSVDQIGNVENVKTNCFFVDKTPPLLEKTVGDPSIYIEGQDGYFVVELENPTGSDITGDIELYGQIDGSEITNEACAALSEDINYYFYGSWGAITWNEWLANHPDWMDWSVTGTETRTKGEAKSAYPDIYPADWAGSTDNVDCGCGNLDMCDPDLGNISNQPDVYPDMLSWNDGKMVIPDQTIPADSTVYAVVKINPNENGNYRFNINAPEGLIVSPARWNMKNLTWVTPDTPITFTCTDPEPHPSGDEELCFKVSYDLDPTGYNTEQYCEKYGGNMENDWCCGIDLSSNNDFVFEFDEESMHDLEYFCRDAVNKSSDIETQYYKVDDTPPVITKTMIGPDHIGYRNDILNEDACPPQDDDDTCYVKDSGENGVRITVTDPDTTGMGCNVGDITCSYELWWDASREECNEAQGEYVDGLCLIDADTFSDSADVIFNEDSTHTLVVNCEDALGNKMEEDVETFLVDSTPPVTTKTYGDPTVVGGDYRWINSSTPITLTAVDEKVGVDTITYRVTLLDISDKACVERCDYTGSGNWTEITGDSTGFSIPEESCHLIEFQSVDKLGNTEDLNQQCVFVDNTHPVVNKEIGDPSVDGIINTTDGIIDATYITQQTPITLSCYDDEPHPVDQVSLWYRYRVSDDCENWEDWTDWVDPIGNYVEKTIYFPQDSCHELEYYCEDGLGNAGEVHSEIDIVDTIAPIINKTIVGPQYGDCPPNPDSDDECYIDGITTINVDAIDPQPHPVNDVSCYYWYYWNDTRYPSSGVYTYKGPFGFGEDSEHELHIKCKDALGNEVEDVETFLVDKKPPVTTKKYGEPTYPDQGYPLWITSSTPVYLYAYDEKSGVNATYWRNTLVNDENCWDQELCQYAEGNGTWNEYTEPFTKPEQSCHLIEYYSVDNVEKTEEVNKQCVFVDNTPPVTTNEILGPYFYNETENKMYLDGITKINLTCTDPEPHPSGVDNIQYKYRVDEGQGWGEWTDWVTYNGPFSFQEESHHELEYYCTDNLGNEETHQLQEYYVDHTPPVTTKWYEGIYNEYDGDGYTIKWINSSTLVHLDADDGDKNHASGVNKTLYRNTVVDEKYCRPPQELIDDLQIDSTEFPPAASCLDAEGNGTWTEYFSPFNEPEESCHLIEYYSVDNVNKTENVTKECVFVDNTPPVGTKVVGEPQVIYTGEEFDYYVTQNTPITLNCEDQDPHPVYQETVYWRFSNWTDGFNGTATYSDWYSSTELPVTISFNEDSYHDLEYYCEDGLGNANNVDLEYFIVDTQAPVITKTITGPYYGDCLPEDENDTCYIDGVTEINVDVTDPEPHPVDDVTCDWDYTVTGGNKTGQGAYGVTPPFTINFPEESEHTLTITCWDALGNDVTDVETFIVDKTPPGIWTGYSDPYYYGAVDNWTAEWISSETNISAEVSDDGPHKSGINEVKYRTTRVDDEYCRDYRTEDAFNCEDANGNGSWTLVDSNDFNDFEFNIDEDSCHLIEINATDNVNKKSGLRQCAFVDSAAPEPVKTVGDPKTQWNGKNAWFYPEIEDLCWNGENDSIDCWKVTLLTPITMDCKDPEPHPVDHNKIWFQVELDAEDKTEYYCNKEEIEGDFNEETGYCLIEGEEAPVTFYFGEESEHNLKYYCEDALGNEGPVDDEKFKVEGTSFNITLNQKWNLISVPFVMLNDSIGDVFKDVADDVMSVWSYDAETGNWSWYTPGPEPDTLSEMVPGEGYWVLAANDTMLLIGGSLFSPAMTPPSKEITPGWNLIGYWGTEGETGYYGPAGSGKSANCELYSLGQDIWDKEFASLWSYWELYNTDGNPNTPLWIQFGLGDNMDPGAGYWMYTVQEGEYVPSTACLFDGF